jgi:hypothetical protein
VSIWHIDFGLAHPRHSYASPDFTTNMDKNGNDFAYSLPGGNEDGADYLTNAMQSVSARLAICSYLYLT